MNKIIQGDCLEILKTLPSESVDCCVTSPPYYGLRDYGCDDQIGLEDTPELYTAKLVNVFREVKRVLKNEGTLWLNLGDSYIGSGKAGSKDSEYFDRHTEFGKEAKHKDKIGMPTRIKNLKPKDLIGIPWLVAFALRADGWYLRQDIIWHKPNPMPESVTDRCTKSHEYIFLLAKSQRYYYDNEAIREAIKENSGENIRCADYKKQTGERKLVVGKNYDVIKGANKRSVWTVTTKPYSEAHFATYPPDLIEPCILAGCPKYGTVLDPFFGAGTTGLVAKNLNRDYIGIELNKEYIDIANKRINGELFI